MGPLTLSPIEPNAVGKNFTIPASALRLPTSDELFGPKKNEGFAEALSRAAASIVRPQQDAMAAVDEFAHGTDGELHKTMLTLERADITLKYFVSLRNKALEAYREIMHMGS